MYVKFTTTKMSSNHIFRNISLLKFKSIQLSYLWLERYSTPSPSLTIVILENKDGGGGGNGHKATLTPFTKHSTSSSAVSVEVQFIRLVACTVPLSGHLCNQTPHHKTEW